MKYIIDVDKDRIDCSGQLFIAVDIPNSQSAYEIPTGMWVKDYTEPDRKAIEDEVWDFARRIICPSDCCEDSISTHTKEIFNKEGWEIRGIFNDLSYQEAKAKYEAWSKQNIREGDEVIYNSRTRAVVLKPETEEKYGTILTSEFATITVSHDDLEKTGRCFPEIAELLKKMREEE